MDVPWSMIAILGWGVTTAILLLRLMLRFALGLRLLRVGHPLESEYLRRAVDGARSRLGVVPPVGIRCSERVHSPVIWCWGRQPVLLMQKAISDSQEGTDWMSVFCHELAHWRRRDHLSGLFAELLAAVLPWHSLLWWARGRLLKLSEQACDDWVLATGQSGVDYAEILLGLAAERQMAFLPTVIGKEKTMHTRIRRIIQDNGSDPRLGTRWALAVGALAFCTTVGVAVAQRRPAGPEPMDAPPSKIFQEQREIELRESPEVEQQRIAMKRVLERLMKQADEKKKMLAKGNELPEQERYVQQIELKLLVEQIEQLKNRLEASGRAPAKIAPQKPFEPEREARFDALRQGHEELEQRAQKLERELKGLPDDQDQEARELKSQLEQVRDKQVLVAKEMDELKRAQAEVRREKVVRKPAVEEQDREELLQNARLRAEKLARALKEDPDLDPEKATDLRKLLEAIRAEISVLEQESRGPKVKKEALAPKRDYRIMKEEFKIEKKAPDGPPPRAIKGPAGDPRLEAEVQELRDQMKELHGQMQQMQKLLEQAVEQGRGEKAVR
jgi:beta-lactamase regulating signal transducer with metallopeptidase domain